MREIKLIVEPNSANTSSAALRDQIAQHMRERIGLRPLVELVAPGTLPRFELKAKRFFKL